MKNVIRGGQVSFHSLRMSIQLITTLLKIVIAITIAGIVINIFLKFDSYDFKTIFLYFVSKFAVDIGIKDHIFHVINRAGLVVSMDTKTIINNVSIIKIKNRFFAEIYHGFIFGFISSILIAACILTAFKMQGKKITKEKFLRGGKLVSAAKLKRIIWLRNLLEDKKSLTSKYSISSIPFPNQTEFLHTIVLGSTGTGKTNALLELIDQIRANGERAILYDKMGVYTSIFYNKDKDIILNPLDVRSKSWSIFNEVRKDSDFDYLSSALIQERKGANDPFWNESARKTLAVFAREIFAENPNINNEEFVKKLIKTDYKKIAKMLRGTEATSLINEDSEKTALSILAVLSTYVSSLKYLHDAEEKFSIKNWIESDSEGNFLFISSKGDQHDSLKPLISAWLDIAVKSLLSLPRSENRRIWIILDELPSLQQLPSLLDGLSQSRQFGGAFVIALHSVSQLKTIYGKDPTDTIISLCRNKIFFAVPDNDSAEFCSENLGEQEVEEMKEGISYGANEIRDGVSLNKQITKKRLVIPSQLTLMPKLGAYIRFAGSFPVAKVKFLLKKRNIINPDFIERRQQNAALNLPPKNPSTDLISTTESIENNAPPSEDKAKSFDILDEDF